MHTRSIPVSICLIACLLFAASSEAKESKRKFVSFDAAMSAGYSAKQSGDLKASRASLEEALGLASTERKKCEVHRILMSVYAETDGQKKMYESLEYIQAHAPYPAFASLTLRSFLSTVQRKGWQVDAQERYEKQLKKNPKDRVALTVMADFSYLLQRDHAKRGDYLQRLIDLDKEEGKSPDAKQLVDRAFAYKLSKEFIKSAELYESTALLNDEFTSSCFMEAAEAYKQANQDAKSLAAAMKAHELGPDKQARRSLYRWHRALGDLFLHHRKKQEAIEHFRVAKEEANIDAYREQCTDLLKLAQALAD